MNKVAAVKCLGILSGVESPVVRLNAMALMAKVASGNMYGPEDMEAGQEDRTTEETQILDSAFQDLPINPNRTKVDLSKDYDYNIESEGDGLVEEEEDSDTVWDALQHEFAGVENDS